MTPTPAPARVPRSSLAAAKPWALRLWRALPFAGLYYVLWQVSAHRLDADYGWHYRSGQYILAHGVPQHDIFTYTAASFPWINHEWANDVVMYLVAHHLGYGWLAALFAAIWLAALGLTTRWRLSLAVAGLALAALFPYVGVRPVAWTALLLAITLRLIDARRWPWLVPVFILGANLHGGFVAGLAALALFAAITHSRRAGLWLAVCVLATFINPYGPRIYVEIWRTLTDAQLHTTIVEWMPLALGYTNGPFILAAILTLVLWPLRAAYQRWLVAGLFLATLSANRQLPVLVIAAIAPMQQAYQSLIVWIGAHRLRPRLWAPILTSLGLVGATAGIFLPVPTAAAGTTVMPYRSVLALQTQPCAGNLFNHYSFGGYLIQYLPGTKGYIDGRMPSWRDPTGQSYLDRWIRVMKDPTYAAQQFRQYNIQCALITRSDTVLASYLARQGWHRAVIEADAVLWRHDQPR